MTITKKTMLLPTPPVPRTVEVTWERCGKDDLPNALVPGYVSHFDGANLDTVEGIAWLDENGPAGATGSIDPSHWSVNAEGTVLTLDDTVAGTIQGVTGASGIIKFTFTSHGGVPGSAEQTVSHGGIMFSV